MSFVGAGAHWRVRLRKYGLWAIERRHWDHWETIGPPYPSQPAAMTEAHRLARLNRGG